MNRLQADILEIAEHKDLFLPFAHKTVLITGATGLIGSMLARSFLAADEKYGLGVRLIGQIRDPEKAKAVYGGLFERMEFTADPDVCCDHIVHTVSPTASGYFIEHPVETIRASVESTIQMLEAAKKHGASAVYLSSMEQYGVPCIPGQKMKETDSGIIDHLNVRSSYSESKRLCECLCASYAAEYNVSVKIVRLAQTFGAGAALSDHRMPMQFAEAVLEGKDIVLHTEGRSISNFVYLTDAVTGILTVLTRGEAGEAYNVCSDSETRSVREIARLVAEDVACGRISVRIEKKENMGYAPDTSMYLDSSKLRGLGWSAKVGMAEAYRRLLEYLEDLHA